MWRLQHKLFCSRNAGRRTADLDEGQWDDQRTLIHEMGPALGLIHEHSRPDRDAYVYVKTENMKSGAGPQFAIFPAITFSSYDYLSIMHYPNCAYSIHEFTCNSATPDLQTIVPRACHLDVVGGNTITELDREGIRNAYVPGLQALLATGNRPQCGQYEFSPEQTQQACASSCSSASGRNLQ
jgi:Astacin (Peptidase family M12A)